MKQKNVYHVEYYYRDNKRSARVDAYTPLQAVYYLSKLTGRWYLLKDYKKGLGYINVHMEKGVEQTTLF